MFTFDRDSFEIRMNSGDSATVILKVSDVSQETSKAYIVVKELITYELFVMNGEFPLLIDGSKPLKVGTYKYDLFVQDEYTRTKLISNKNFIVESEV